MIYSRNKKDLGIQLERNKYKVVTNSNISELILENNTNLILVLTPERLISFLSQNENPSIGFYLWMRHIK